MERALKNQSGVMTMLKAIVIVVSIAVLHYMVTMYTAEISFTQGIWAGFRPANILKALTIVTPFAGVGIGMAGIFTSSTTGSIASGLYWFLPICNAIIGYAVYKVAQLGPKKGIAYHAKVVALLVVSAIIMTMLVRVNHTLLKFPGMFFSAAGMKFFWALMIPKCISAIVASLAGYPLITGWKLVQDKIENRAN